MGWNYSYLFGCLICTVVQFNLVSVLLSFVGRTESCPVAQSWIRKLACEQAREQTSKGIPPWFLSLAPALTSLNVSLWPEDIRWNKTRERFWNSGIHSLNQVYLELAIMLLPLPPKCGYYIHEPLCLALIIFKSVALNSNTFLVAITKFLHTTTHKSISMLLGPCVWWAI